MKRKSGTKMLCAILAGMVLASQGAGAALAEAAADTAADTTAEEAAADTAAENTEAEENILTVDAEGDGTAVIYGVDGPMSWSYESGETVHIRAVPALGSYFAGWTSSDDGEVKDASEASTSLVMPDHEVTLTAHFLSYSDKEVKQNSFLNTNGVMWFYNTYFDLKYSDITDSLDELKENGINVIGFFCPYDGDKSLYDGCDPMDWYDVPEQCGTMDDFRTMVAAAHDKNMKVICYFVNIYIDKNSEYFKTAEKQYAAGEYDAQECSSFCWTTNPNTPLPEKGKSVFGTVGMEGFRTHWEYSEVAGAYYCNVWRGGGLDFDLPGAHAISYDIEKFWLDAGLDGFMFDVAKTLPEMHDLWIRLPQEYTANDKWLATEKGDSTQADENLSYGYNCWFNYGDDDLANDYTRVINGEIDADGLEEAFGNSDYAHSRNAWTFAWSPWGDEEEENLIPHSYPVYENDELMRVQEAALLAGGGITYGCGIYDEYLTWSDTLKENWGRVLKTVSDNSALLPSASRKRLETQSEQTSFAMERVSVDGSQKALLIYNLSGEEQTVAVNLNGSEFETGAALTDLYQEGNSVEVTPGTYEVSIPAYGFMMLGETK
ncbi:MAG: alpha-amylase family glycosyl hydrolase [Lachnospiraceae bacterium]|nr:alpha-amylase family glycosyl hydrolase [Lachnospiraceae bacterium]